MVSTYSRLYSVLRRRKTVQQKSQTLMIAALLAGCIVVHSSICAYGEDNKQRSIPRNQETAMTEMPQPFACNVTALKPAQRTRHSEIIKQLRAAVKEVKELPDGYTFRYTAEPAHVLAAAEFITLESRCCSFFRFTLAVEPNGGPMWLHIAGPTATKPFIKGMLVP